MFDHHLAFAEWMKKRNKVEKVALRSLDLVMDLTNRSHHWYHVLSQRVVDQLPGIAELRLEIRLFKFHSDSDLEGHPLTLEESYMHESRHSPVRILERLPLTKVEVVIIPNFPWNGLSGDMWCDELNQWTESERQCYADLTKRMLLDSDAAGTEARLEAERSAKTRAAWPGFFSTVIQDSIESS